MEQDFELTLPDVFRRLPRGDERGYRIIGRDRSERFYSFEQLEAEAYRRAAFLAASGLVKGDRVALIIAEPHDFILTLLGAVVGGLVPVPIFPRASFKNVESYIDVLAHIVSVAKARVAICMEGNRDIVMNLEGRVDGLERIANVETFFDGPTPAYTPPVLVPDDLAFLQFTSGSTSKPKGVMVTHRNLVANATSFLGRHGLDRRPNEIAVSWLPLFHDMGLIGFVFGTLVYDIEPVILPTETFARAPGLWLETISKYKASITFAPNFAYGLVTKRVKAKDLESLDLSSMRVAGCGAEPIRAQTLKDFATKFAPAGFPATALMPAYGMAESTLAITFHPVGTEMIVDRVDGDAMKRGVATPATDATTSVLEVVGCGKPFPGHDLAIVDDDGKPLPERTIGQVVARGPSVTPGYFENPEATADALRDGWLQTGDLGYVADGHLFICGRMKDLIIIRGANFYPQDLEWSVSDLDGVRRGNVVAFSVLRDGIEELVIAAESNSADASRLREEIKATVSASFGVTPFHVAMVGIGALPKTSSGKAQRRKSKSMFELGELQEHA